MSQFIEMFGDQNTNDKGWSESLVKDEFKLSMGKTPARNNPECWDNGNHKWVSISDMSSYARYTGDTSEYITDYAIADSGIKPVPKGTIIMSFKLSIGRTAITSEDIYTNEAIMAFADFDEKKFNIDFLHFLIANKNWLLGAKQAVKGQTLNKESIGNAKIIIPPIEMQEQFASIYNQADKSEFVGFKSQFIEMYHKTHNTQTLESVCAIISKGITPKYVDFSSVAVVNQACIQWDGQHLENIKYHNEEILFKKRTLQTGDVLLNATGTGTLGRCCVFNCPSNDNIYINDGHVIALATDKSILLPEVLKAYLSLNDTQAEIYRLYVTGSTNQVDIVFSDIKKMKVPVPDIDDQISFVKILNQADKSKSYVRIALKNLESILGYCIRQVA